MGRVIPAPTVLAEIAAVFAYDPETGVIARLSPGRPTGWRGTNGYLTVDLATGRHGSRKLKAHCVAWFLQTGAWPPADLDIEHENRDRTDNRWGNLSLKTRAQNLWNSNGHQDSKTGVKGVWEHSPGRYVARIMRHGKARYLGIHGSIEAAHRAYIAAGGIA